MQLSALLVSFNVAPLLARCLRELTRASAALGQFELQIIVVDNASSDDSVAMVRRDFPEIELLALDANIGFGAAVNRAAQRARGDLLLLLNPDCVITPADLARLAALLDGAAGIGAIGPRHVDEAGRFQLSAGPGPSLLLELGRKAVQRSMDAGWSGLAWPVEHALLRRRRTVPWLAASCLLVRREAFDAVSGFDENFFLYFEDIDLCLRLGDVGWKSLYEPTVQVLHTRGASAATASRASSAAYRRSQIYYWRKHRGPLVAAAIRVYLHLRGVLPD